MFAASRKKPCLEHRFKHQNPRLTSACSVMHKTNKRLKLLRSNFLSPALCLLLILQFAFDKAFAQCDTSRWKASIDPGGGGAITEVLPAQTVFQNGVLTALPQVSFPSPYFVSFTLKDTFCITNNFAVEVRLKNDPSEGGAVSGDTWLSLNGSGIAAGCLLEGVATAQQYTGIYAGNTFMNNLPQLVMDLSTWRTIRLDFVNNVVNWSYDGSNFFSMSYTGSICNINNLLVGFREAGQVDYIKIFDAANNVVYYEEFTDCNNIDLAPDCLAPDVIAASQNAAYCEGDSIHLAATSNVSVQFTWSGPSGFSSTLQNPVIPNALPSQSGWYKITGYVNPCTPVNKDSVFVTVHPKKYTDVYPYICPGESYSAGGGNQTTAGLYYDTLTAATGCDSIILTYLSILSTSTSSAAVAICSGDSFFVGGSFQKLAGVYKDTLTNQVGCDSVITTTLSLIAPVYHNTGMYICQGDSVMLGGAFQHSAGIYYDTTNASTGCDSIIITTLTVIAPIVTIVNASICEGESYFAGGALQTSSGTYQDTLTSFLGCDSVIVTTLQVIPPVTGFRSVFICENDSLFAGGAYQHTAGLYVDTLVSAAGCDSILTTDLQLIPPVFTNIDVMICQGDSLFTGGAYQQQAGFYNDTLISNAGCDSIVITHLQLILPVYSFMQVKICLGDSFFAGGAYQSVAGSYVDTLLSATACDSIVTTELEIIQPVTNSITVAICNGESFFAGGSFQTTTGTYLDTLQSAAGCDSLLTTYLQVIYPVYASNSVNICDGEYYFAAGANQTLPGNYQDTLTASNGCDSIITTQLTVLPNPLVYLGQDTAICEGTAALLQAGNGFVSYSWNDGSHQAALKATMAGLYWVEVTDQSGCSTTDSIVILDVLPNPSGFLPADSAVCGMFHRTVFVPGYAMYNWSNGYKGDTALFTLPGQYSLQVTDFNGCIGYDAITFESDCEKALIMPNAFTPNGDGLNDVLKPILLDDITDYELKVFNRWGQMVFYSKDPANGWDGREKGKLLPIENYIWSVHYVNGRGQNQFEKGSVSLLK